MEDESSLELSLALFCGASSSNKSRVNASEPNVADEGTKGPIIGTLNIGESSLGPLYLSNEDSNNLGGQQRCRNFWEVPRHPTTGLGEDGPRYHQIWGLNENLATTEDKFGQNKRKSSFDSGNISKKYEMEKQEDESHCRNLVNGDNTSHISFNSEGGSSSENELVEESEIEASDSCLISQYKVSVNDSQIHNFNDSKVSRKFDILPQENSSCYVLMNEPKNANGKFSHERLLTHQAGTAGIIPANSPNAATASTSAGTHLSSTMQRYPIPGTTQSSVPHAVKSNSFNLSFLGYQSVQLPTLESSSSWMFGSHLDKKTTTDTQPNSLRAEDRMRALQASAFEGKGKQSDEVGVPSAPAEDENEGNMQSFRPKLNLTQHMEGLCGEGSIIRPGIAPGMKFGGCGSYPDLPWVSATGSGPNAKTISGVTYKFSKNQINIVCACHGSHMSPEEFIRHANAVNSNGDNNALASFVNGNPTASTHS